MLLLSVFVTTVEESLCSCPKTATLSRPLPPPGGQVRYRREHASGRQLPFFPLLEDLMRDVCDGAALLTVVHSYCPDHIKLEGKFSNCALCRFWKQAPT